MCVTASDRLPPVVGVVPQAPCGMAPGGLPPGVPHSLLEVVPFAATATTRIAAV